jgi:hypothetical protein
MNDTGSVPFWDLNPASLVIAILVVIVLAVCVFAYLGGKK